MITNKELKLNMLLWAEVIDPALPAYFGKQIIVKFTGIQFREVDHDKAIKDRRIFLLPQLKLFREAKEMELERKIF